jgi:hypothetical protein
MSSRFVIGGGWSVSQFEQLDELQVLGHVIGVNDAAIHTYVHEAVTMDRLWFENRWAKLRERRLQNVWVREKCDCNVPRKGLLDNWTTFKHFNTPLPSVLPGVLHGGNSGTCAINLAFQQMLEGDTLYLLGFDMCNGPNGEPYWYPPYPWARPEGATKPGHFQQWSYDMETFAQFAKAKGFNVYNVSMRSQIKCFPKLKLDQMLGILHGF